MESATTNLSELTCDFVRLWDAEALQHKDVRELFVHQASVVSPEAIEVQIGQEVDTELVYPAPTNEQVPSLKGLLEYIGARGTGGAVNKYITNRRKHFTIQEGAVQQIRRETTVQAHRHEHLFVNELHTTLKRESHMHTHTHQLSLCEYHTNRKQVRHTNRISFEIFSPVQVVKKVTNRQQGRYTNNISLEIFSPVQVVKKITNVRITRPVYIFAS